MSAVDIFYLALVLAAFAGFAIALAYFSQQKVEGAPDSKPAKESTKPAPKHVKPKAPSAAKVAEHV